MVPPFATTYPHIPNLFHNSYMKPWYPPVMNKGTVRLEHARKYVLANWKTMPDSQMAKRLKMTLVALRRLRYRMGLIRMAK